MGPCFDTLGSETVRLHAQLTRDTAKAKHAKSTCACFVMCLLTAAGMHQCSYFIYYTYCASTLSMMFKSLGQVHVSQLVCHVMAYLMFVCICQALQHGNLGGELARTKCMLHHLCQTGRQKSASSTMHCSPAAVLVWFCGLRPAVSEVPES